MELRTSNRLIEHGVLAQEAISANYLWGYPESQYLRELKEELGIIG